MLKKIGHLFIVMSLLVSTTGITLHKHYSEGVLYSVALAGEVDGCCTIPCDCCTDEVEFFKLDNKFLHSFEQQAQEQIVLELMSGSVVETEKVLRKNFVCRAAKIPIASVSLSVNLQEMYQVFIC